jgi:hypothetical protein
MKGGRMPLQAFLSAFPGLNLLQVWQVFPVCMVLQPRA